ncbi:hypothetical protein SAMN04488074_105108 [Lentzea albidocapillata subsp. violacea]|uniref:Phage gp6-like head-tail connector protein n=1 Tax=Lentzea albidocapillata subsp. violacea TaxID=128104 RepID=A0A1G9ASR2_9PSEU|nr:hypothetical protein [Lentzea albidocapillata]SDK30307.1 hypothetical protein SAMN04488074_105108 [Lentzea albidocapillata subsp. violacea]
MPDPVYIQRESLKASMRISDDTDDELLDDAIHSSCRAVDNECGRRFWLDPVAVTRIFTPHGRISRPDPARCAESFIVDDIGVTDDIVVEIGSGSTWTDVTSSVEFLPENAIVRGRPVTSLLRTVGWPLSADERLRVSTRWGWPSIPAEVVQASRILTARRFRRKDSPEGVAASDAWGPVRVTRVDPDVEALLQPLRRLALA